MDDDKEILRELIEELRLFKESLSGINSNTNELSEDQKKANAEIKKQNEASKKAAEEKAAEQKKIDDAAAAIRWASLSDAQKDIELAQMQAKKEADQKAAELEKVKAYGRAKSEVEASQLKYIQQRSDYELKSYGYIKDSQDKYHKLIDAREQNEQNLLEHFSKILEQDPVQNAKFGGDAQAAKYAADQERMYKQQLASMNRTVDEFGKLKDTTIKLNSEQQETIKKLKKQEQALAAYEEAMDKLKDATKLSNLVIMAGTVAFTFLKAAIMGTYKGLINYENALLDGQRGQSAQAEIVAAQLEENAAAFEKLGGSLTSFGTTIMSASLAAVAFVGPIALIPAAIGGLLALFGQASEAEAAILKRQAELEKRRAKMEDDLYQRFQELGEASMTGARGATELKEQLSKVGLTILEFDKLNKVLSANSKEIAMFGIGVEGVNKYVEVTSDLINNASSLSRTFEKMGISQQAQREHAEKYMALQARLGTLQGKTTEQLRKGTENYIIELDKTAALTGLNRKDQEQAREAVMAEKSLRAAMLKAQAENNTVELARLQRYAELSKYYEASGQTEEAAGIRKYAAGGVTDEQTAYVQGVMGTTFDRIDKGIGTPLGDIADSMKLLNDRYLQFADVLKITGNISGLTGDVAKFADANISIAKAMERLKKENPNANVDDLNKLLEEIRKPATDGRTEKSLEAARKTQADALAKQEALLNGQLGAVETMKSAIEMFFDSVKNWFNTAVDKFSKVIDDLWKKIKDWTPWGDNSPTPAPTTAVEPFSPSTPWYAPARVKRQGAPAPLDYNIDNIYGAPQAPQAPKMAEGGIIPGTSRGTTVAVGEKGKPEAIIPLEQATQTKAPKMAKGGIIPGTEGGTTVAVGEKGKPEAIIPLEQLKGMLGGAGADRAAAPSGGSGKNTDTITQINVTNKDSDAIITRLNVTNNSLNQTSTKLLESTNKLLESNNKLIEASSKQLKVTEDNNKLLGTDGPLIKSTNALKTTDDKLIVSMTNVTNMLPNVLAQIVAATGYTGNGSEAGGAAGGAGPIPQASTPGGTVKASATMLKQAGLIFNPAGDIQKDDGDIDPKLIQIAKQVQASVPGFIQFSGFNDNYHKQGQHSKGKAFDFVLNKAPSKEQGAEIVAKLKSLGLDYARDEYNDPSETATGGHIHGQLNAYDGGVFEPRPGGVHVNLAEAGFKEAAVPLNPGEKIRIENSEQQTNSPRKEPLGSVLADNNDSNSFNRSDMATQILSELHDLMESKLDSMISAIRDGNDISDKLLKYSQV